MKPQSETLVIVLQPLPAASEQELARDIPSTEALQRQQKLYVVLGTTMFVIALIIGSALLYEAIWHGSAVIR